jgi:hypothetical protein
MSTPLSLIAQGTFTSTGVARAIELPRTPHYFMVKNRSLWGTAPTAVVQSDWSYGYGVGQATCISEGGGSALTATAIAAGGAGFTYVDLSSQAPGALVATGTAVTAANPAVVSDASNPPIGSIVRMLNTTGMLQIAGMDFTVTAVNAGVSYTLGYLNSNGWAAAATNADYRIIPAKYYSPYRRWITGITQAASAVITVSVAHNYLVGDKIVVHVPRGFGMTQIDGIQGTITAVTASTMTVNIDSTGFTAFAFPTSAVAAAGVSFPHVTNVGEVATKLTSSLDNTAYYAMYLDTGVVGANGNVMDWVAFARDYTV